MSDLNNTSSMPPKNYLVESILVTIFCCLPFGVVGIIKASEVNTKFASGDVAGAKASSAEAKKWTKIGLFVGLGINLLVLVVYGFIIGAAVMSESGGF